MAGTILTTPYNLIEPDHQFSQEYLINNGDTVNSGDLVGVVVVSGVGYITPASKTQGAVVIAWGIAFYPGINSTITYRVGDGLTQRCAIARSGILTGVNSTLIPALGAGKRVYLGAVGSATVSNYTCTQTTTNGDALQPVGYVSNDATYVELFIVSGGFQYQTAGNSTVNFA